MGPFWSFSSVVENFVESSTRLELKLLILEQRKLFLSINSIIRINWNTWGNHKNEKLLKKEESFWWVYRKKK